MVKRRASGSLVEVAVLFARADSNYKLLPAVDVWDIGRDAAKWLGGVPGIYHPSCRSWGRMRQFSNPRDGERALAIQAVERVRKFGGVLEHPAESTLWATCGMPRPRHFPDVYGGWTLAIKQFHWGHRAEKETWLYIVGCAPADVPERPRRPGKATACVRPTRAYPRLPCITKREREETPMALCIWLCELARRCKVDA